MNFILLFFVPFLFVGFLLASLLILIKDAIIASLLSDVIARRFTEKCLKDLIPAPPVRLLNYEHSF